MSSCSMRQCPANWQHYRQPAVLPHPVRSALPGSSGVLTTATGAKLLTGDGREFSTLPFIEHTVVWLGCTHNR